MKILDTIAAVSTPRGKGGVAVIRISGDEALSVACRVFEPASGKCFSEISPNRMVYGSICEQTADGERVVIDDGMAVFFKAPHSFTGEDTVEINCHGGRLITEYVLSAVNVLYLYADLAEKRRYSLSVIGSDVLLSHVIANRSVNRTGIYI